MSTIILTSSGNYKIEGDLSFLPKPIKEMKMAYITTASKGENYASYVELYKQKMKELDYDFEEVDLDDKNEQELKKILADKELIYIEGGNTFYLLKAVRKSGSDKIIKDLVASGVIYMGSSAGAYIACPTIEVSTWVRPDRFDRHGITNFTALNLVPFLVVAHYDQKNDGLLKEKIKTTKYPVKILTDDQALLVKDGKVKLIGYGEEIKLK
jgi:dipeptidase E